mgnify:CR=1 FL=1
MDTRFLDDLAAGQTFKTNGVTLSEGEIIDFAWRYDPQPFHLDVGAATDSPYGGLIASGEPIGASGLRQIHELVRQLRGEAGERQIPGTPKVGYAQLYGAPGTAGVSIITR